MTVSSGVTDPPSPAEALWTAVDAITKPSTMRVLRDHPDAMPDFTGPGLVFCRVEDYRALTVSHGVVPSLWEQAEQALTTGREQMEGSPSPQSARSPADLDLMETMLTIRESLCWQLPGRGVTPRDAGDVTAVMRQLAAHVVTHEPGNVDWWAYRFGAWARLLAVYLRAIDTGPRPVRLRNAPCPLCKTRQVIVDSNQGPVVAGPLEVDFVNGWIRAATCTACTATWWRGNELGQLAELLEMSDPEDKVSA